MLSREDVVEIVALHRRGWSVSAIARHTGRNRKTVRAWLAGRHRSSAPTWAEEEADTGVGWEVGALPPPTPR
jgi:transposase